MKAELNAKIDAAVTLLRRGERLATAMNPADGYFVGFSGGKDSQVLLRLVQLAGVKYHAYYSVTTNDPPPNVRFIREYYPDVTFLHPKETFFKLVEKKGLPTMHTRYCCDYLKERNGVGSVCLTGVRAEESRKRARYNEVSVISRRKEHADRHTVTLDSVFENQHRCIKGKDKLMIYPLLKWTKNEVWQFIDAYDLPRNPCYEHFGRVGCMFCPFSSKRQIDFYEREYPGYKAGLLRALEKYWQRGETHVFHTPEEYYEWWKSKKTAREFIANKRQFKINFQES